MRLQQHGIAGRRTTKMNPRPLKSAARPNSHAGKAMAPPRLRRTGHPDAALHDPDPKYLRALLAMSGMSVPAAAKRLGLATRTLQRYVSDHALAKRWIAPYPVQFGLECMAVRNHRLMRRRAAYDAMMSRYRP